ncbi:hypothetical protein [Massilia phosphatilytica]
MFVESAARASARPSPPATDAAVVESVEGSERSSTAPVSGTEDRAVEPGDTARRAGFDQRGRRHSAWLFKLQPSDPAAFNNLLDAAAYGKATEG